MLFADSIFIPDEAGNLVALAAPLADAAAAPMPPSDVVGTLVKMLLALLALIALLFGTYWILRRLIQNRMQRGTGEQAIAVLEKKMVSPKTMLYLVQVEEKKILFAESHLEVKALGSFDSQPVNDESVTD